MNESRGGERKGVQSREHGRGEDHADRGRILQEGRGEKVNTTPPYLCNTTTQGCARITCHALCVLKKAIAVRALPN